LSKNLALRLKICRKRPSLSPKGDEIWAEGRPDYCAFNLLVPQDSVLIHDRAPNNINALLGRGGVFFPRSPQYFCNMQGISRSHRKACLVHCFDFAYWRLKFYIQRCANRKHPISGEDQVLAFIARRGYADGHNGFVGKKIVSHERPTAQVPNYVIRNSQFGLHATSATQN
jgi:hypothetical protein